MTAIQRQYSIRSIIITVMIVLCTFAIDISFKYNLEKSARIQAKYNLRQIKFCVNDLILMDSDGLLTNYGKHSNYEIEKAMQICAKESLVSPTGDVFAFDLKSGDFIFDPSLDCYVEGGKKMTAESECTLHKDPAICKQVMQFLTNGYDSDTSMMHWWQFDDAREYLEWVVLPDENRGFDGSVRSGNGHPHQVVVAQGVQEDELWARYKAHRITIYAIALLSIIINLTINYAEAIRSDGRRKYDYK